MRDDLLSCPVSSRALHLTTGLTQIVELTVDFTPSAGCGQKVMAAALGSRSSTTSDGRTVPIEVTVQRPDDTGPILVRLTDRDEVAGTSAGT